MEEMEPGGLVKEAFSLVSELYSSYEEGIYKEKVLNSLKVIEADVEEIKKIVESMDAKADYNAAWAKSTKGGENPLDMIYQQYGDYFNQKKRPSDPSTLLDDIDRYMTSIYHVVTGNSGDFSGTPIIELFYKVLNTHEPLQTSEVEITYQYLKLTFTRLLKGLALLAYYKDDRVKTWNTYLTEGNADYNPGYDYEKHPYLKYMAYVTRNVLDKTYGHNADLLDTSPFITKQTKHANDNVLIGTNSRIPDGHVVVGIAFEETKEIAKCVRLVMYSGEPDINGVIDPSTIVKTLQGGDIYSPMATGKPHHHSDFVYSGVLQSNVENSIRPSDAAINSVITNVGLEVTTMPVHAYWHENFEYYEMKVLNLKIEVAQLHFEYDEDKKVTGHFLTGHTWKEDDFITGAKMFIAMDKKHLNHLLDKVHPEKPNSYLTYISMANSVYYKGFTLFEPDTSLMKAPLTGVELCNYTEGFFTTGINPRYNFHHNLNS